MTPSPASSASATALGPLLASQRQALERMLALLQQERSLLTQANPFDALHQLGDDKASLVNLLSQNDRLIDQWLRQHQADSDQHQELQDLKALAGECSQLNLIIGELVGTLSRRNQERTEMLMSALGRSNRTYDGKGNLQSRQRLLAGIKA
ncbi:flagellar export chaperone FlgN [Gallaecimonas sp. GXIMD4217]|uniref:flagellar export chaperone FlgN n=1 Tax=Gallaecimonas sp. GXIMD4217 TaxID=3131927 RepID=UPI00311B1671